MENDNLRQDLAKLIRTLLEESARDEAPISDVIREHLGGDVGDLPIHGDEVPSFELANVQLGLDAMLSRPGFDAKILGVAGQGRRFSDTTLGDLVSLTHFGIGAPEYTNEPVGPN